MVLVPGYLSNWKENQNCAFKTYISGILYIDRKVHMYCGKKKVHMNCSEGEGKT